jgi:hypothetical protein
MLHSLLDNPQTEAAALQTLAFEGLSWTTYQRLANGSGPAGQLNYVK